MSRVLFLLPSLPDPPDAGARIRNAGLLRLVAADHEVDVLAFGCARRATSVLSAVRHVRVVTPPVPRSRVRRLVMLAGATDLPDMANRLASPEFEAAVDPAAYDAVQAEGIEMARYLLRVPPGKRVYDAHNAEFLLQCRASTSAASAAARMYSRLQWRRLERFERSVVRASRMTLAVSNHDANQLLALARSPANVHVVPNGIDVDAYPFRQRDRAADQIGLLFMGKLDFRPNAEAVRWFLEEVFPGLERMRLFAVGSEPPGWLVSAGQHNDRIAVTGHVADERPYLARCAVMVLPIKTGGGSRLKALIALASGVPIVSTRVGMEGLEAEPGVHFLSAETPIEWRAQLQRLQTDQHLARRLAVAGHELVRQRYDWSAIRPLVQAAYDWLP